MGCWHSRPQYIVLSSHPHLNYFGLSTYALEYLELLDLECNHLCSTKQANCKS